MAFDAWVIIFADGIETLKVKLNFDEIVQNGAIVMYSSKEVYFVVVDQAACHASKLEVGSSQLQLIPNAVLDAVDPYILDEVDVVSAPTFL